MPLFVHRQKFCLADFAISALYMYTSIIHYTIAFVQYANMQLMSCTIHALTHYVHIICNPMLNLLTNSTN